MLAACPALSLRAAAFSAGGDDGRKAPELPEALGQGQREVHFLKRGSVDFCFAPTAAEVLRCRELTRCAHLQT